MNIPDELLAAYVDGELEGAERARIEQAILHDARIAQRVAHYRALRARMRTRFDGALHEPMSQRLLHTARSSAPTATAQIIDLARVRAERKRRAERHRFLQSHRIAIAASLIGGLLMGMLAERLITTDALTQYHDGALLARGVLAQALDNQLAGSPVPGSQVRVGLSFKAKSGDYCRTFSVTDDHGLAGLACHAQDQWRVLALVGTGAASGTDAAAGVRMAASASQPVLMQAVRQRISGAPLDAQAEQRARGSDWR
ncbi:MAG TPA: zf-HC2 domain-containing protein [Steroidobacteraceae bacterium]|jgi:hypothetical protein|nr:zf-HC2 domain-containing protein [Steroidobacteraceae bacterium]